MQVLEHPRVTGMTAEECDQVKAMAAAKLRKIQQSPGYKSFFDEPAIEAFRRVESTAFAGTPSGRRLDVP